MVEKIEYNKDEVAEKDLQFKLKTNELKYKILIENLPQKIFLKDKNSVYVSCNKNYAQDLGIDSESIAGKTDYDFFPEELAEKYRDDDRRIMFLGETEDLEETYFYNGEEVYVHTVKTPIRDENNTIIGIIGIFWDITGQHKIYKKLVASEHNLLERVKELTCIYELSNLFENPNNNVIDIIRGIIKLIPPAWQFPTITCARIIYNKKEFKEDAFRESEWKLFTKVEVNKKDLTIEVFYLEDKPFLDEEGYLLNDLGNRLRNFIEQRETEQQFRFLFESSPDPIFLMDLNGILKNCNLEGEKKFGYTREELIGKSFMKFSWFLPETMPLIMQTLKTLVSGKIPDPLEIQQRRKDGTLVWVYVLFSFMTVGEEKLIQVITQDISKIKEAEQKLRENEQKLRTMTSSAHDAIIQVNHVGDIVFWNKAAENMFGYSSEEILSRSITLIIPERYRQTFGREMEETMKPSESSSKGKTIEAVGLRKDGTEFPTELSFSFFHIIGKRNSISIVRDITERKKAEEEIRLQSEIIENMSEGVFLTKLDDGTIVFTNPAFDALFGYNPRELIGKNVAIVNAPTDKTPEETREEIKGILKDAGEWHGEVLNVKKDGTLFWCYGNISLFDHPEHGMVFVAVNTDITDRRNAEKKIQESEHNLGERVKELTCLYGLSKLVENADTSIKEILQGTLDLIPPAWQFPEITCAKIKFGDNEYKTRNFKETDWNLSLKIVINSRELIIKIFYLEDKPFLKEEKYLLDDLGKRLKVALEQKETEQKLRENEEKYRTLTNNIPGMVYRGNLDWSLNFIAKCEEICGYSVDEFLSQKINWSDIIHHDDKERIMRESLKLTEKSLEISSEYRIIKKDGDIRWVNDRKTSIVTDEGIFKGVDGIVFDITERVLYEKHLQQTHNQLDQIFNASIPMYVTDMNFNIIKANERFVNKFQVDVNEIIGRKCYDIWKGKLCNTDECSLEMIKKGVDQYDYEMEKRLDNDSMVNYIVKNYPYRNNKNELIGCIKAFTNITERIKIEKTLRESEEKYRNVLENIKEGYYEVDMRGNFTLINDGFSEIFGYLKEEMIESHYSKLYDKKNMEMVLNVHNSLFKAGESFTMFDCEAIKKNGKKIFVESSVYLKYKEDGEIIGYKGFLRNITERKQAEALEKEFNEILEKEVVKRTVELNEALEQQKLFIS